MLYGVGAMLPAGEKISRLTVTWFKDVSEWLSTFYFRAENNTRVKDAKTKLDFTQQK